MVRLAVKPRKLSEELAALHHRAGERAVTLRELIYFLRGRAYMLLIILLALPFIQPVPLPGLSTPLGLAIVLIALRLSLGQRPWLPKKIQRLKLPAGFFGKLITFTERLIRFMESVLRPRIAALTATSLLNQLHAIVILVSALVLLLPLPIPFSNVLPAWAIFLTACGLLERDGLFIVLGYVALAIAVLYFVFLGEVAHQATQSLIDWWKQ
ncbi:exopolysaccharide biosynthesis protein [Oleiharenicola lentus]|uniref:exopolysaccharide biosynthesis protein n=1 Tax=Oleiharenicola lentus TaxID=2508720 RepID=UPI003F66DC8F